MDSTTFPRLEDALLLATQAHRGKLDKTGAPYILHPIRLMLRLTDPLDRLTALLHDVVEDSPYTLEQLRTMGYPEDVVRAVDLLTHRESDSYDAYVEKIAADPRAVRVKLADLKDNMDQARWPAGSEAQQQKMRWKMEQYQRALERLEPLAGA